MKKIIALGLLISAHAGVLAQTATLGVTCDMSLSFQAKSKAVKGFAKKEKTGYTAKNVVLPLATLDTGLGPRNTHMLIHFNAATYPNAELIDAKTTDGSKFTGNLKVNNVTKPIEGTYKLVGSTLQATFTVNFTNFGMKTPHKAGVECEDPVAVTITLPVK